MLDKNPLKAQHAPWTQRGRPFPLVLIHDGGGTTFGYFSLGSLRRDVWALHNPHFFNAEPWKGGMDEMAEHYIGLMEQAGIKGPIILGGWSLGGYLSLAIARMLKDRQCKFSIVGMLIIDSPYHIPLCKLPDSDADPDFDGLPELVQKSLDMCDDLLETWELPDWDGPACGGKTVRFSVGEQDFVLRNGSILYKPLKQGWQGMEERASTPDSAIDVYAHDHPQQQQQQQAITPPPAVMIRCVRHTPPKKQTDEPCRIDMFRDEPFLGWDGNYPSFIKAVIDVDTHHYDIFDFRNIDGVTKRLNEGLEILETLEYA